MDSRRPPDPLHSHPPPRFPIGSSDYGIGIALGSPGLASAPGQDAASVPRIMTTITSPAAVVTEQPKPSGLSRQISKRLPFLGRSKSRRANANNSNNSPNNFSRPCADPATGNYTSVPALPQAVASPGATAARTRQSSEQPDVTKLKKQKPVTMRSVTDPQIAETGALMRQPQQAAAWIPGQAGPMLDIEIPDIKLDRYSVMFGSLLAKEQTAGGLLARRQATLARLRTIEDEVRREHYSEIQRHRRVTSPAMTPVQSTIPEVAGEATTDLNVAPLRLRSNTYPANSKDVDAPPTTDSHATAQIDSPAATSILSPSSQVSPRRDSEDRPLLRSKFHKPSVESIRSPYFRHASEKENSTELSPPPAAPRRLQDGSSSNIPFSTYTIETPKKVDIPSRSTSMHTLRQAPAVPREHPRSTSKADAALEDAAEVSIARQISISRQQRRLLEPLHERELRRARSHKHMHATSQISVDGNKRIVETKKATPTVIHPQHLESPQNLYRRSERVTIEGA